LFVYWFEKNLLVFTKLLIHGTLAATKIGFLIKPEADNPLILLICFEVMDPLKPGFPGLVIIVENGEWKAGEWSGRWLTDSFGVGYVPGEFLIDPFRCKTMV